MAVIDTDILRVVASMLWSDGNVAQNVFNCVVSGGVGPYTDSDVADDMEDWLDNMYANITAGVSDELDGNSVTVYKYDSGDDDWDEVFSQAWGWNPTAVGDQLPRGVAALIRMWTEDPDVQGKKYIAGWNETDCTDGLFPAPSLVTFLAFAADWVLPFVGATSGATFTPGVWSVVG
ncbi:unnamed protein product, partial [marine sediment metagenome]